MLKYVVITRLMTIHRLFNYKLTAKYNMWYYNNRVIITRSDAYI